jgi:hypothetical protein
VGSLYRPGGIVNPFNLRNRSLKPLLERAGLPPIRSTTSGTPAPPCFSHTT